ncbi:MAG: efflux transporter outer membrane subunit [Stenotrophobium sp.]
MRVALAAATTACMGLLAACSFAPAYQRPATPAPASSYTEAGNWKTAQPGDTTVRGQWWTAFGDAQLDMLESRVEDANQDLKAAVARFQQARAQARYARADYFPTVTAGADATRQRQSQNRALASPTAPTTYNDFLLNADLSYEIDVWGRVRNAAEAGKATAQASAADLDALDLAIHAELAMDYFSLRADDSSQALLDDAVAAYRKALALTRNRYRGGVAAEVDVDQAQAQLQTAITQATDLRLKRTQLEHAIAVLVGVPASVFSLPPAQLAATMPAIDPGLPSSLLERRPDIAAAERRTAAANAAIGVARAAYFPVFSLAAAAGLESGSSANWISAPSQLWAIGPSALLTLFDGGRRSALSDQARAAYDETAADYRQTVLTAYREVEDNLAAIRQLDQENSSENLAAAAAQRALTQANYRYKGGIATYLEVVAAQNTALQAQLATVDIQARQLTASVLLIKALGGGWDSSMIDTAKPSDPTTPAETAPARGTPARP